MMGVPGALDHPKVRQACEQVAAACQKNGKIFALGGVRNNPDLAAEYAALGARFIIAGMDASYFQQAAGADVIAIRKALKS
jgi:4-hydroxy-2-oxoheptanedioate aldolase